MKTRISTRVIIYKNNKVLLTKNPNADFWYPGGGKWEKNETVVECCMREVKEEIGYKVRIIDIMYAQEFYTKNTSSKNLELFFLAKPLSAPSVNSRCQNESRWFNKDDMKKAIVYPKFMREQFWKDIKKFDFEKKAFWLSEEE